MYCGHTCVHVCGYACVSMCVWVHMPQHTCEVRGQSGAVSSPVLLWETQYGIEFKWLGLAASAFICLSHLHGQNFKTYKVGVLCGALLNFPGLT